ncbi:MAG: hypothetical protein JWO98_713 [Frankiales bacterium]|nr:hypothetical protein [Frankiales bacterium]
MFVGPSGQTVAVVSEDRWKAVISGEAPLDWELWASPITHSRVLTPEGKATVRGAVETITEFFGADWLSKFAAADRRRAIAARLPLLSTYWWPINDTVHVYWRILELAARLSLLRTSSGFAQVRKDMRGDLGHFAHGLLQLEVGALALRSGWTVRLEPVPRPGAKTDLFLSRDADAMFVEAKDFQLDAQAVTNLDAARRVQDNFLNLSIQHSVYFEGDFDIGENPAVLDEWLLDIARQAADTAATQTPRTRDAPSGGQLRIAPGMAPDGIGWSVPVRRGDEWRRIRSAIANKAEQARGDAPLWLRFDETSQFWLLSARPEEHLDWLRQLANGIAYCLSGLPHVAGLVLSSAPASQVGSLSAETQLLDSRATHLVTPVRSPFVREFLIVANPAGSAGDQAEAWLQWYRPEGEWLSWALDVQGYPPLEKLFLTVSA